MNIFCKKKNGISNGGYINNMLCLNRGNFTFIKKQAIYTIKTHVFLGIVKLKIKMIEITITFQRKKRGKNSELQ